MISATGRMPVIAAPIAAPRIACSEIGVSQTRSGPNSSNSPAVVLNTPPAAPMSSPRHTTRRVAAHLPGDPLGHRLAVASVPPCRPSVRPHVGRQPRPGPAAAPPWRPRSPRRSAAATARRSTSTAVARRRRAPQPLPGHGERVALAIQPRPRRPGGTCRGRRGCARSAGRSAPRSPSARSPRPGPLDRRLRRSGGPRPRRCRRSLGRQPVGRRPVGGRVRAPRSPTPIGVYSM